MQYFSPLNKILMRGPSGKIISSELRPSNVTNIGEIGKISYTCLKLLE
jgi:hypothetical protein|tara:strand:+ start:4328 stop:4471 length:144 start_codon:yes stop_codon:yes gene_type:complete